MGLTSSKTKYRDLYEPIQVFSPMTRFHMISITMADSGLLKTTEDEYMYSRNYVEEKGIDLS